MDHPYARRFVEEKRKYLPGDSMGCAVEGILTSSFRV
jgi:hypothetical protein